MLWTETTTNSKNGANVFHMVIKWSLFKICHSGVRHPGHLQSILKKPVQISTGKINSEYSTSPSLIKNE